MSWVSNKSFLNYDNYKLNLPSTKIDDVVDKIDNIKIDDIKVDKDDTEKDKEEKKENKKDKKTKDEKNNKVSENEETVESTGKFAQSFASLPPIKFFDIKLKDSSKSESENEFVGYNEFAGYSDSNLLWLMSQYIEKNLWDNNEILVTVEYDDLDKINRIILKSGEKWWEKVSGSFEVYYVKDSHSFFTSNSDSSKDVTIKDVAIIDNISQTNVKNDEKKEEIEPVKNNNSTNESEKTGKEEAEELYLSLF